MRHLFSRPSSKVASIAILVPALLAAGCNSPAGPSPVGRELSSEHASTGPSAEATGIPGIAQVQFQSNDESGLRANVTTEDGVTRAISVTGLAEPGAASVITVDNRPICVGDEPCEIVDRVHKENVVAVIAAAVLLALALDAARTFWQTCANRAVVENKRTGTVSWSTVGECTTQAAVILAGGRLGKYLEGRGARGVKQLIEGTLRGAVPQDQLRSALTGKNFITTVGLITEAASRIIESAFRSLYDLARRL